MSFSDPRASAIVEPSDVAARIQAAGIHLPMPPAAAGTYQRVVVRERMGFVSGQFPFRDGQLAMRGRVGAELSVREAGQAAEIAALNVLAQIQRALLGWHGFAGLLRLDGFVASVDEFVHQPAVLDAASKLFVSALGERLGAHARIALAVPRLPLDAPIELSVSFAVR